MPKVECLFCLKWLIEPGQKFIPPAVMCKISVKSNFLGIMLTSAGM